MEMSSGNGLIYYNTSLGQFVGGTTTTTSSAAPATASAVTSISLGSGYQDIALASAPRFWVAAFLPGNPTSTNGLLPGLASNLITSSTSSANAVLKMRLLFWGCALSDDPSVVGTQTTFTLLGFTGTTPTTLDIFNITESGMSNGYNLIASNWITLSSIPAPPSLAVSVASASSSLATYRVLVDELQFVMST